MTALLPRDWLNMDARAIGCLAPVQWLDWPPLAEQGLQLAIKREDLLHPEWGGNKVYKLHGHLRRASERGCRHLLSFGGPWSNHIHALAAAGHALGFQTTGVIRGQRPPQLSAMLKDAEALGMALHFVSRAEYARKQDSDYLHELRAQLGPFYAIPEGGGGAAGAEGACGLGQAIGALHEQEPFDVVCVAAGTGCTLAGLAAGVPLNVTVCGFSVLRSDRHRNSGVGEEGDLVAQIRDQVRQLSPGGAAWHLQTDYHCGGYARVPDELALFMQEFEVRTGVPLDPVYTAKMMWGITRMALAGHWPRGTRILAVHSGGLQGRRGFGFLRKSGLDSTNSH